MNPENRDAMARAEVARSVLHAACALLAKLDERPRTHRGVQRRLDALLVKPEKLDAQHLRAFNRLQERRNVADYGVDSVTIDEARELVELARAFVAETDGLV